MWTPRRLTLIVTPALAGCTVKELLRGELKLSNTAIKYAKNIPHGILLDGAPVFVSAVTVQGQVLCVLVGDVSIEGGLTPTPGEVELVYEDEDILIVNKAPGVVVHPTLNHPDHTLGNFVAHYYQATGQVVLFRPVHRLDRGTSGLLCIAKHAHAQELLKNQLHTADFRRVYLAVCQGIPTDKEGTINAPIARAEDSIMMRQIAPHGAQAITHYSVLQSCGGRSLLQLELTTGRTHQIRVHMAHIGHPLTGDFLYGKEEPTLISRTALHAAQLSIVHPITKVPYTWNVPLPADMAVLIE